MKQWLKRWLEVPDLAPILAYDRERAVADATLNAHVKSLRQEIAAIHGIQSDAGRKVAEIEKRLATLIEEWGKSRELAAKKAVIRPMPAWMREVDWERAGLKPPESL